uniref:HDC14142 n=1 Tax=Drosophila melanogaster TaxID=7227 RepID=Q6IJV1_DROME|nr:TPA_inf: HDC14142 [Drosophila melanogaster]
MESSCQAGSFGIMRLGRELPRFAGIPVRSFRLHPPPSDPGQSGPVWSGSSRIRPRWCCLSGKKVLSRLSTFQIHKGRPQTTTADAVRRSTVRFS